MEKDLQTLMNEVYDAWRKDTANKSRLEMADSFSPIHVAAVQLGNLNYQVENGGFLQWWDNGYKKEDIHDLIEMCKKGILLNIENFQRLYDILNQINDFPENLDEISYTKYTCSNCGGEGVIEDWDDSQVDCEECCGDGYIEEEEYVNEWVKDELNKFDKTYYNYDGWLKDFQQLINRFDENTDGIIIEEFKITVKPICKLVGTDGNAFSVMAKVRESLRKAGLRDQIDDFLQEATSGEYNHLLAVCHKYVDIR